MTQAQSLNEAYKRWKNASNGEAENLLSLLVKSLEKLALSICWRKIPDLRSEFPWVVNEATWRAISGEGKFGGKSQFSVWFYRIVVNECNRLLKRTQKLRETTVGLDDIPLFGKSKTDRGDALQGVLQGIGWPDQTLIALKAEGWSTREIAGMLDTSEAAVKMRWSRLKGRLRDAG
jgi:RNA polymerase sigma-70 factor (ECF subfamily)